MVEEYFKTIDPTDGTLISVGPIQYVKEWTKRYCEDPDVKIHLGQVLMVPATKEDWEAEQFNAGGNALLN